MKTTFALVLLGLIAAASVADAQMYCKVSSYKIAATVAVANKNTMFTACAKAIGFKPVISSTVTKPDGCVVLVQRVANKDAWTKYSDCEKNKIAGVDNSKAYGPLKAASDPCEKYKKPEPTKC